MQIGELRGTVLRIAFQISGKTYLASSAGLVKSKKDKSELLAFSVLFQML